MPKSPAKSKAIAKKQKFSDFDLARAYKQLGITKLIPWQLVVQPMPPSDFFQLRLKKLERFDLRVYEESKKLLIDAFFEEAIESFQRLKIWKGASLETDELGGYVDYLVTADRDYLEAPFLCVVEAKKDDFEQGLAQCLVEMQACQYQNQRSDLTELSTIFGIVTNGEGWKFYRLDVDGKVYETVLYSIQEINLVLGVLHYFFMECDRHLNSM
jgi:hypothetical protein